MIHMTDTALLQNYSITDCYKSPQHLTSQHTTVNKHIGHLEKSAVQYTVQHSIIRDDTLHSTIQHNITQDSSKEA